MIPNLPKNNKERINNNKKPPTALVAGGAGFIGCNLTKELLQQGYRIVIIDNFATGRESSLATLVNQPYLKVINHDLNQPLTVKLEKIDQVWHLISQEAYLYQDKKANLQGLLTNSLATKQLLDIAGQNDAKFLLASSLEVYRGLLSSQTLNYYFGATNEDTIRFSHAESKRYAEALTWEYFKEKGLNARICRLGEVYGPGMNLDSSGHLGLFIKQLKKSNVIQIEGDGLEKEYYIHIDDLVSGLLKAMNNEQTNGKILPISSLEPITALETAYTIKALLKDEPEISFTENPEKAQLPDINPAEYSDLKTIRWSPKINFKEGLVQLLNEYQFPLSVAGQKLNQNPIAKAEPKKLEGVKKEELLEPPSLKAEVKTDKKSTNKKQRFSIIWPSKKVWAKTLLLGAALMAATIFPTIVTSLKIVRTTRVLEKSLIPPGKENTGTVPDQVSQGIKQAENLKKNWPLNYSWWWDARTKEDTQKQADILFYTAKTITDIAQLKNQLTQVIGNLLGKENTAFDEKNWRESAQSFVRNMDIWQNLIKDLSKTETLKNIEATLTTYHQAFKEKAILWQTAGKNWQSLLGYEQSANYLLILRDSSQSSLAGGKPLSAALVKIEKGKITEVEVSNFNSYFEEDELTKLTSAKEQAEYIISNFRETGYLTGVVSISSNSLPSLLANLPELYVSNINQKISPENVITVMNERVVSSTVDYQGKEVATQILQQILQETVKLDQAKHWSLLEKIWEGLQKQNVTFYNPAIADSLKAAGWSGEALEPNNDSDLLGIFDNTSNGTKASFYLEKKLNYKIKGVEDGQNKYLVGILEITYRHTSPTNSWPAGKFANDWQLLIPKSSQLLEVKYNQQVVTSQIKEEEALGGTRITGSFEIGAEEVLKLSAAYQLPDTIDPKAYRLNIQSPWGEKPYPVTVAYQGGTLSNKQTITTSQGQIKKSGYSVIWETIADSRQRLEISQE